MFWSAGIEDDVPCKPVTVDVGGVKFSTSRETITSKSPFFKRLLDRADKALAREVEGVFVDRDPKHFGLLLNYMRTGKLLLDGSAISDVALEEIALEAQFYRLANLMAVIARVREIRDQTRKNKAIDPSFPFFGFYPDKEARKSYCRTAGSMDMGAFSKAFTSSFEATLNELIAMGFEVEKVEWNEGDGHRSYAILSISHD